MNFVQSSVNTMPASDVIQSEFGRSVFPTFLIDKTLKIFYISLLSWLFLETDECLEDTERKFLKTFYLNNENVFLITYQIWQKYGSSFYCFDEDTIRLSLFYETNKVKEMVNLIKELNFIHAKVTVLSKTFFQKWLKFFTAILCRENLNNCTEFCCRL